jgi:hypothetical protein
MTSPSSLKGRGSSVGTDGLLAEWPGFNFRYGTIFLFSTASRPILEPTQLPNQWVRGLFLRGVK